MFELGCYSDCSIGYNTVWEILAHIKEKNYSGVCITDRYNVRSLSSIHSSPYDIGARQPPRILFGLEIDVTDAGETFRLKCIAKTQHGINNLYGLVGACAGQPISLETLCTYREGLYIGANGGWDNVALCDCVDFWFISPDMDETVCKYFYESVKDTDKLLCAVSDGRYIDPAQEPEHAGMNRMYGEEELIKRFAYLGTDVARKLVSDNPRKVIMLPDGTDEGEALDGMPRIPGGFHATIRDAGTIVSEMLRVALHEKYTHTPNTRLVDRLDAELPYITREPDASMFLASARIAEDLRKRGYRMDICSYINTCGYIHDSFAAYLVGITNVNPVPAHYLCPKCKTLVWADGVADGYDLADRACPNCATVMECDGHDIPFEALLRRRRQWRIEYCLPHELEDEYIKILSRACPDCYILPYDFSISMAFCILPKTCSIEFAKGISTIPPWSTYDLCDTVILHPSDTMSRIAELETATGCPVASIRLHDRELIEFLKNSDSFCDRFLSGIPEFEEKGFKYFVESFYPQKFSDLLEIYAAMHGSFIDDAFPGAARRFGALAEENAVFFCEDVFRLLTEYGLSVEDARHCAVANMRHGKWSERTTEILSHSHFPSELLEKCRKLRSKHPKGYAVHRLQTALILAWYKQNHRAQFFAVRLNHTPRACELLDTYTPAPFKWDDFDTILCDMFDVQNAFSIVADMYYHGITLVRSNDAAAHGFVTVDAETIAYAVQ